MNSIPAPPGGSRTRRVFLECTSTLTSRYNTGIQRAGRNLVNASLAAPGPWSCAAIVYNGRRFIAIDRLPSQAARAPARPGTTDRLRRACQRTRSAMLRAFPAAAVRNALHSQRLEYALRRMVHGAQNTGRLLGSFTTRAQSRIDFRRGDVLVLLDPAWSVDLSRELARARGAGAEIWVVVNDLIPIDYPELAPEGSPILMDKWLRRVLPFASGMLGISRSVADGLRAHLECIGATALPRIGYFYLGAGLDHAHDPGTPAQLAAVAKACGDAAADVYLAVGTVEPRKNHRLMLDVFDRLWGDDIGARLLVFGRLGWRSNELARRMREHPQLGRRLFWFEAGSDAELDYAYRHASALIFASRCEGFGLPLVEAMHYGLPVIASDIPVFREIGGDYPTYFNLDAADSLEQELRRRHAALTHRSPSRNAPQAWLSWTESARVLLEKVTCSP